ncbi:MAG TPA: YceI family protein [Candidatus Acidoferrales bacterium]|nr:YceI family protein [Candidatus Acidoferrales bacterium]
MENQVRFVFDAKASQLTIHAFASGLVAVVAHNPRFGVRDFSGEAAFVSGTLAQASIRLSIKANSLSLIDEVSEYDLREIQRVTFDEVLESKTFPEIVFESSRVTVAKVSENLYRATIMGSLMLHGVTHEHNFNAQVVVGEDSLRGYGDSTLKQTDYGIQIASIAGGTLKMKDEVKIAFFIIGRKKG